jgi:DNA-binding transcriptional regulator LsrR (DeoR family)
VQGAVAEICARIIDDQGRHMEGESSGRVVAITIDQLRKVPEVVLVSGGRAKRRAVAAALRSGFITSLITDANVAHALLDPEQP